jgi:hypothetical protein
MTAPRRLAGTACWVAALAGAAVALEASGGGALAPPPLTAPGGWGAWLDGREPVAAALAIVRLAGLGLLWYLAVATLVGVVLRLARAGRLVAVADRLTVPPLRRLLAGSLTAGLLASGPGALALAAPALRGQPAAASQPGPTTTTTRMTDGPPATITMHALAPAGEAQAAPPVVPTTGPPPVVAAPDRWTVQPGQCLWTIAEAVLRGAWGRPPTDAEIVPYWHRLIDANRHVLAHAGDPDLIFPGQVFEVPPA